MGFLLSGIRKIDSLRFLNKNIQETAEKILGVKSDELGYWLETDEEKYNAVFQEATFKTYSFRMRVKEDNYNDESKLKHTVNPH